MIPHDEHEPVQGDAGADGGEAGHQAPTAPEPGPELPPAASSEAPDAAPAREEPGRVMVGGEVEAGPGDQLRAAAVLAQTGNEALPANPPEAAADPLGSVPLVVAARRRARAQLGNWRLHLVRFLCAGIAVVVTVALVPGLRFSQGWRPGEFLAVAVVFGLLNVVVKPLLQFVALRFIFATYGLVVVLINALLLVLLSVALGGLIVADRLLSLLAGGLIVGLLGMLLETVLGATPPVLDRDYKERNRLS